MTAPKVTEYHRLSREEFDKLAAKLPAPFIGSDSSPQQAGFLLGIQFALAKFREAVVIG